MRERNIIRVKDQYFIVLSIVLLVFSKNIPFLCRGTVLDDVGDFLGRTLLLVLYLFSAFLIIRDLPRYSALIKRAWPLWILVALAMLSTFWATLPEVTFRRSVMLLLATLYGIYLGGRSTPTEMILLFARVFFVLIIMNIFVVVVFPEYGIHQGSSHFGAWRGFTFHKNGFGNLMQMSAIVYFILAMQNENRRGLYWFGAVVSLALVIASDSVISLIIVCVTCSCTPFLIAIRWPGLLSKAFYIFGILFTGVVSFVIAANIDRLTDVVGRDATFTGRTVLWQDGLTMILERPWGGYGYGSEWVHDLWGFTPALDPELVYTLSRHGGYFEAMHNGYLQLIAQVGMIGFLLYAILFIFMFIKAVLYAERSKGMLPYWPLYFLLSFFVYNFFEGGILERNSLAWIMFVMIFIWLTSSLPESRDC